MNILEMDVHPLAKRMPKLEPYAKAALKESMETQGFDERDPIVIWCDPKTNTDRILDGANRRDIAKQLGITDIPVRRFDGDRPQALAFVHYRHLARRAPDKSQRALIVAQDASVLHPEATIEKLAEIAGCSISQMEKASAIAHKSKTFTARGIRGEMSVNALSVSPELNHIAEDSPAGADPWHEIRRTTEKLEAFMAKLTELVQRDFDPLLDRRGGEMVKLSIGHRVKGQSHGMAFFDGLLTQIRRNLAKQPCPRCGGAGCADCGGRTYITAHEKAALKNAERNGVK